MYFKFLSLSAFFIITAFVSPLFIPKASAATLSNTDIAEIVRLINKERLSRGISVLRADSNLEKIALERSGFLAREGRIYHLTAPAGTPWPSLWNNGYPYSTAGENLALGIESPESLVARWMASPSHRENLLSPSYNDIGIGITSAYHQPAGRIASYVVAYFGKKRASVVSSPSTVSGTLRSAPASLTTVGQTVKSAVISIVNPASTVLAATSAPADDEEAERIRLMKELIGLLQTYLRFFGK